MNSIINIYDVYFLSCNDFCKIVTYRKKDTRSFFLQFSGSCICNELFGGEDCATPRSTPPSNVSLPDSGLCDVRKRACKKTYVYGYFIPPDIYCKTKHFEVILLC